MLEPLARWTLEAMDRGTRDGAGDVTLAWVPPRRVQVDPMRETQADILAIRAGLASRQGMVRERGYDPEDLLAEQIEDRDSCATHGLRFDSDVHFGKPGSAGAGGAGAGDQPDGDQAKGKGAKDGN